MDVNHARDLPDLRIHLLEAWRQDGPLEAATLGGAIRTLDGEKTPSALRAIADWERYQLREATLWWVAPDMCDLLAQAMRSVPADTKVPELPMPSPAGLVVFGRPMTALDAVDSKTIQLDAILWGTTHLGPRPGLDTGSLLCASVSSYGHRHWEDGIEADLLGLATVAGAHSARIEKAGRDGNGRAMATMHGSMWCPLGRSDWPLVDPLDKRSFVGLDDIAYESFCEDRRLLAALWTICATETVTTVDSLHPERAVRRRSERAGVPVPERPVSVVVLRHQRRPGGEVAEAGSTNWTCRWVVTGHWRRQRCGPSGNDRRLTWIPAYVKGPEGAPLRVAETVRAWVR